MGRVTDRRPVTRLSPRGVVRRPDTLAVEEPLELRVDGRALVVTMRTPGDDVDLAHGFLLSEGVIGAPSDVVSARHCVDSDLNVLDVRLAPEVALPTSRRNFVATSACGVCGKESIDDVRTRSRFPLGADRAGEGSIRTSLLSALPDKLRAEQRVFDTTGGLHAAGLFSTDGELLAVREDVGRHNAVDKVVGWGVREDRLPLAETILIVSGRASFELVQKAVMAGIPVLGAVSAPSSLAVDLAHETGLTLVGFLRGESMNVYAHDHRLAF
jgi:FdhD protein